jgi:beta-lactamase regulating signal transducer with metallopeptidase domain
VTGVLHAGAIAKGVLATLAMTGLQGTVLALLALVLVRGRRPAWHAAVWLVVLAKFALPWGPAMPWSLADLLAAFRPHEGALPQISGPPALAPLPPPPSVWPAIVWLVLASLWAAGTAFFLGRAILRHLRAARMARAAAPAPAHVQALVPGAPRIVIGNAATGPHVVGILRPTIVVPPSLVAEPELLRAALLHEVAHVRRRDAAARLLQVWAGAVFFFWPVVRFAGRRLDLAREAACDAWALEASALPRPAYARLLLEMARLRSPAPALAMPHALDARVAAVLGPPIRARLGWPLRAVLALWIAIGLGGARSAAAHGHAQVCHYTPELAEELYRAFPEADVDGDGLLSRDEACGLQAELRSHPEDTQPAPQLASLLEQPLCCNCVGAGAYSPADAPTCQEAPGVTGVTP